MFWKQPGDADANADEDEEDDEDDDDNIKYANLAKKIRVEPRIVPEFTLDLDKILMTVMAEPIKKQMLDPGKPLRIFYKKFFDEHEELRRCFPCSDQQIRERGRLLVRICSDAAKDLPVNNPLTDHGVQHNYNNHNDNDYINLNANNTLNIAPDLSIRHVSIPRNGTNRK